jgi:probable F420-dependent oxidoreductase
MKLGVVFPQTEIGSDPVAIRDYAQTAEGLGYDHLLVFDHVLGADVSRRDGWRGAYALQHAFHEPFVLFGFLAAATQRLELVTGVLVLPQRQTALVAKQAAEVDVLSGGRLRLGVGIGWNAVEYEALGEPFGNRGRRVEEQIAVLRALWSEESVSFDGRWHSIPQAGINPMPVRRPIPIWIGGGADPVLRRTARLADGYFPLGRPNDVVKDRLALLRGYAREAGRDPADIGIEGSVGYSWGDESAWAEALGAWRDLGATHVSVNTMGAGFTTPQEHIAAIRRFKAAAEAAG